MSEQPGWMPTNSALWAAAHNCDLYATCGHIDPMADLRDVISEAVEKALAEQWQENLNAKEELIRRFRELSDQQEARHRREVIEAQALVLEIAFHRGVWSAIKDQAAALRAQLAAPDKEVPE